MTATRVMCVLGTRPEAIKMAPVIRELRKRPASFETLVLATGQHREMLHQALAVFDIKADIDLGIMSAKQTPLSVAQAVLEGVDRVCQQESLDAVLVQGDTTSAMASAMAAFHHHIKVGHIEAGLRTQDLAAPFPEEFNRRVVGVFAQWHFVPTGLARQNLLREGCPDGKIFVTGNTVVDAVHHIHRHCAPNAQLLPPPGQPYVVVTCHRRENHGSPIRRIFGAIRILAQKYPEHLFWFPAHPSPQVQDAVKEQLKDIVNVSILPPVDHPTLIHALAHADLVLTDSGGIQEEAPSFGKRVLVLRETTERPEGVAAQVAKLVGTDPSCIIEATSELLNQSSTDYRIQNPYGDGFAANRIADTLEGKLPSPFEPADITRTQR